MSSRVPGLGLCLGLAVVPGIGIGLGLGVLLPTPSASASTEQPQHARAVAAEVEVTRSLRYLVQFPEGYHDDPAADWPLILFLHGAGERGDNLDAVKTWGPPRIMENGPGLPAIVVSPQCPADSWWEAGLLLALLDEVEAEHRVDADRVYVTGLSMGGFGTWDLGRTAPDRFAALAPVCGGTSGPMRLLSRLRDIPIWAFHGSDDGVVPLSASVDAAEAVRRAGGDVKLTVYEGVGHDSWRNAYSEDALWEWMFQQSR